VEQKARNHQPDPNSFSNRTIAEFLKKLASEEPVPGGGSVAALAGSLGASLIVMYCRIGMHRKGITGDDQEVLQKIITEASSYEQRMTRLITEDSLAYGEVIDAFKLPKTTEEETKNRQQAIQKAFKKAAEAPLQTLIACVECLYLVAEAAPFGNPSAFSDLKVAKYLCDAGARAALENIEINIPSIKDPDYLKQLEAKINKLKESLETVHGQKISKPA
jgi:formiminotetrahydrofolate cyclodeaminase